MQKEEKEGFQELVGLYRTLCEYCAEVARVYKNSQSGYLGLFSWSKEELDVREGIKSQIYFCRQSHDLTDDDAKRALDIAVTIIKEIGTETSQEDSK
jgi:hypothetical protein